MSANPADWTPHVLDGKVDAIVQVGDKMVAGDLFTRVANAATPATAIPRSNIFAFDAATGLVDTAFAPVFDGEVELRLSDGARITAFKGKTNARVKDMAVSGGRLYIGGTFKTVNAVARTALAALDPVTGALSADLNLAFTGPRTGTVNVDKFDITPDGSRLVAIGNWTSVAGLRRDQIVMLNLAARPVAVTGSPGQQPTWDGRIAFMPPAGGTEVPESRVGTLPGDLFRLGLDGTMTARSFDGAAAGPATRSPATA